MPKVVHNRKQCISCSACAVASPDNYEMSEDDGMATMKRSIDKKGMYVLDIDDAEVAAHKAAGQVCPVRIIRVLDDRGRDITDE